MRGKALYTDNRVIFKRITPAYAGKSCLEIIRLSIILDHPRLCGEKIDESLAGCEILGSPPPMRGKVKQVSEAMVKARITPAYAGKSM